MEVSGALDGFVRNTRLYHEDDAALIVNIGKTHKCLLEFPCDPSVVEGLEKLPKEKLKHVRVTWKLELLEEQ